MDPSATPWRVLEDPVDPVDPTAADAADGAASADGAGGATAILVAHRSTVLVVGVAAALAVAAFVLAFGSASSGTVDVQGGTPLGSQRPGAAASGDPVGGTTDGRLLVVQIGRASCRERVLRLV